MPALLEAAACSSRLIESLWDGVELGCTDLSTELGCNALSVELQVRQDKNIVARFKACHLEVYRMAVSRSMGETLRSGGRNAFI
mmetsp:Transcript_56186/g.142199  ORF Transcript_56186/g.142199 Transcript_56186/m.142199 type:complete len:84 (+) Transcript_56186:1090-1341(+)